MNSVVAWLRTNPSEEWWEQPAWQIDPILLVLPPSVCEFLLTFKVTDVKRKISFLRLITSAENHQAMTLPSQAALSNHMPTISQWVLHQLFLISVIFLVYWFWAQVWNQMGLCSKLALSLTSCVALGKCPRFSELLCILLENESDNIVALL